MKVERQGDIGKMLHIAILVISCFSLSVPTDDKCFPCLCRHTKYGLAANCSAQALRKIPRQLPHTLAELNLRDNNITQIRASDFKRYDRLKRLLLSKNNISILNDGTFSVLRKLQFLELSCNNLHQDKRSLPANTFQGLIKLKVLAIHGNNWKSQSNYRDDIFIRLPNLEELHLDGLPNGINFGNGFKALRKLTKLYIYGGFDYISNATFEVFNGTNVKVVHINSGQLYDLETLAFSHFTSLQTLSMSGNTKLGLLNASHCFEGLLVTTIKHLYLQKLVPQTQEELTNLKQDFYEHLVKLNIESLRLDANNIGEIMPSNLTRLSHIHRISLNCNLFHEYQELWKSGLGLQNITFVSIAFENSLSDRRECYHYAEYFPDSPKFIDDLCFVNSTEERETYGRMIDKPFVSQNVFVDNVSHNFCPNNLVFSPLSLETVILKGAIAHPFKASHPFCLFGAENLKYLDYSNTHVHAYLSPVYIIPPTSKEGLSLISKSNGLEYITPDLLSYSINNNGLIVKTLDLYDNKLGQQLIHENFLGSFKDLEDLNLGENGIKLLKKDVFINQTQLVRLSLSHNSLSEINFEIIQMKNLKYLNLANNLMPSVHEETMGKLDALINQTKNFTLDLSHNLLVCSCKTMQFLDWPVLQTISRGKGDAYKCYFDDEPIELDIFYKNHFFTLKKHCASKEYLMITGVLAGLIIVSGAISVCIYRHRWDVRFLCLKLISERKKEQSYLQSDVHYKYNAFVAYHQNDIKWVTSQLLKNLEGHTGSRDTNDNTPSLRLCLHHRDFLPGTPIEENIVNAIRDSRKIILVVSRDFVTSGWCDFEVQMARMRCFDEGQDLIIAVMLETVSARIMSATLQNLIRRNTYIEWPKREQDKPTFWTKLKTILSTSNSRDVICECGRRGVHTTAANTM